MIKIVHASIDEHNQAKGGSAGDQTGKEVCIRTWYKKPWDLVLRYPDSKIADIAANIAGLLASSNLVGYDQTQRNSLYNMLKKFGFVTGSYISTGIKTETDCSAFVTACYVAAGIDKLKYNNNAPTTRTMESIFKSAGFNVLKDPKYLDTDKYLRKGDILVKAGSHTVMAFENGSEAYSKPIPSVKAKSEYYPKYSGSTNSFVEALKSVGETNTSLAHRKAIAQANGYENDSYYGSAQQNIHLLRLLINGKLRTPEE